MPHSKAYSPAGISSFFQAILTDTSGSVIEDLLMQGSRGGGISIRKGVITEVQMEKTRQCNQIDIMINGNPSTAPTSRILLDLLLPKNQYFQIHVKHILSVPSGCGFGTSGAGALSLGLAVNELLETPLTYTQIAQLAHKAEIMADTGLGTISGLVAGHGVTIVTEPGAPGIGRIDSILSSPDLRVVAVVFGPIKKSTIIKNPEHLAVINQNGETALNQILSDPTLSNFFEYSQQFAKESGFIQSHHQEIIDIFAGAGAIGATVNMIGNAVHGLIHDRSISKLLNKLRSSVSSDKIIISEISYSAAHLM